MSTLLHCYPFAAIPLLGEPDQTLDRPEIRIGMDEFHTPPALAEGLVLSRPPLIREKGTAVGVALRRSGRSNADCHGGLVDEGGERNGLLGSHPHLAKVASSERQPAP